MILKTRNLHSIESYDECTILTERYSDGNATFDSPYRIS